MNGLSRLLSCLAVSVVDSSSLETFMMPYRLRSLLLTIVFVAVAGCGGSNLPDLGQVSGTVTFEGKPLSGALVEFVPENGRPSFAETASDGTYSLNYLPDAPGAVVGKHLVRITQNPVTGEVGDNEKVEKKLDPIPMKYNKNTILEAEVTSGSNVVDFELTE
jgi:hypothetical protein